MINKVKSVKEIRNLIDKVILPGYIYKTNFSCAEYLIEINFRLIIKANLIKKADKMIYEFVLDTQFLNENMISYEELKMVMDIIEILEDNRNFTLLRLKKYTVLEYEKEQEEREKKSEMMLEALKSMFMKRLEVNIRQEEEEINIK